MKQCIRIRLSGLLAGAVLLCAALAAQAAAPTPEAGSEAPNGSQSGYEAGYRAGYRDGYRDARAGRAARIPREDADPKTTGNDPAGTTAATGPRLPETEKLDTDYTPSEDSGRCFLHSLGAEFRPEYIFPTNPFLEGGNRNGRPIDLSLSGHFRYAFQFRPGSLPDRIYGGARQGLGIAYYDFQRPDEIGNPVAVYLFQGACIARIAPRITFDYEWNFGLSFGWNPYDPDSNPANQMMGSKINAYLNVDFLLRWRIMREVDLTAGVVLTHFSNGNTKYPNAGLNSLGARVGLTCNFGRTSPETAPRFHGPAFPRHVSYDLVLFGSWRRRGIEVGDMQYAAPDAYTVVGFNFAPMYNFGYKFRAGISVDGVYDGSANVISANTISEIGSTAEIETVDPGFDRQIALGLSARAEFVMPYFQIGIGLGGNILHKGGDLNAFYQMLTLKVAMTRSSFLHIGYSLRDFHLPNFLMLGVGYRFNNKYPRHR